MKRHSAWYLAVLLVVGCGGGSEAGEAEMVRSHGRKADPL